MDPIPIQKAGPGLGQVGVPNLVSLAGEMDAFDFLTPLSVEYAEFYLGGMFGKYGKIDPSAIPGGP